MHDSAASAYRASTVAAAARRAVASVPPARVAESDPSAAVVGWGVGSGSMKAYAEPGPLLSLSKAPITMVLPSIAKE